MDSQKKNAGASDACGLSFILLLTKVIYACIHIKLYHQQRNIQVVER